MQLALIMSLREHNARKHPLDGGLVVHVAKDPDAIIALGAQDTVIMARQEKIMSECSMAQLRLNIRFPFWTCLMI